jgi:hypothetical protein
VTFTRVFENLIEQISAPEMIPEMMMGITDWQVRLKNFFNDLCKPLFLFHIQIPWLMQTGHDSFADQ